MNIGNRVTRKNGECFPDGTMVATIKSISESIFYHNDKIYVRFFEHDISYKLELKEIELIVSYENELIDNLYKLWVNGEFKELAFQIKWAYQDSKTTEQRIQKIMNHFKKRVDNRIVSYRKNRIQEIMNHFKKRVDNKIVSYQKNPKLGIDLNIGSQVKRKNGDCFPNGEMVATVKEIFNNRDFYAKRSYNVYFKGHIHFDLELNELELIESYENDLFENIERLWLNGEFKELAFQIELAFIHSNMMGHQIQEIMNDFKKRVEKREIVYWEKQLEQQTVNQ
ncbi:hypothetical protein MZM54_00195 [[Brevibacterium] frigoritolerans]|nr:hypothetical protein [Peribacillus frigoritolerans]